MFKDITRQIPHKQYFPPCPDKRFLSQTSHDLRVPNGYFTDSNRVNFNNMMFQFFEFVLGFNFLAKAICDFCKILEHFIDSTYFGLPIPKLLRYFDLPFSNTSLTKELNWLVSWMAAILFLNQAEKNLDFVRERFHSNKSPMYSKMNAVCKQCSLSKGCNTYNILQLGMFTLIYSCQWGMNTDNIPQMVIS